MDIPEEIMAIKEITELLEAVTLHPCLNLQQATYFLKCSMVYTSL